MRRRRALLVMGVIVFLLLGYLAWCLQPFYRHSSIEFCDGVDSDIRVELDGWLAECVRERFVSRARWSWASVGYYLSHPYSVSNPIEVGLDQGRESLVGEQDVAPGMPGARFVLSRTEEHLGAWKPDLYATTYYPGISAGGCD